MKTISNVYKDIYDMENLKLAHKNARKDKSGYHWVRVIDSNPDKYLQEIQDMLKNKTYKVSEYKIRKIWDKTKERTLMVLPYFPDRIIQWAILLQISSTLEEVMLPFTCASLPNGGIHKA